MIDVCIFLFYSCFTIYWHKETFVLISSFVPDLNLSSPRKNRLHLLHIYNILRRNRPLFLHFITRFFMLQELKRRQCFFKLSLASSKFEGLLSIFILLYLLVVLNFGFSRNFKKLPIKSMSRIGYKYTWNGYLELALICLLTLISGTRSITITTYIKLSTNNK